MVDYEITIIKRVLNPEYQPKHPIDCYQSQQERAQFLEQRQVTATLTDAEFNVIKQALLTHWAT